MDDEGMIFLFVGSIAVIVIGLILYSTTKTREQPASVPMTLTEEIQGSIDNPSSYYEDLKPVQPTVPYTPIVQNDEKITWTDWLGRDRVITITRTVH